MKSNEVGTTLKHPETINGNVKNLSKRMKMKDKGESDILLYLSFSSFYFKNFTLPLRILVKPLTRFLFAKKFKQANIFHRLATH
jgi:hypothetical protein